MSISINRNEISNKLKIRLREILGENYEINEVLSKGNLDPLLLPNGYKMVIVNLSNRIRFNYTITDREIYKFSIESICAKIAKIVQNYFRKL